MNTPRTRLLAVSGATLALIVAGTAVVSAHPGGDRGDRAQFGDRFERRGGDNNRGGIRGQFRQRIGAQVDDFVRRETMVQTEDGVVTRRIDTGAVDAASETSLDYTLSTGEAVSVTIDEDTSAIAFAEPTDAAENEGRRRFRGPRLRPTEISVADIAAGSNVIVTAQSLDDGSFVAQRVVVQPDIEAVSAGAGSDEAADAAGIDSVTLDIPEAVAA